MLSRVDVTESYKAEAGEAAEKVVEKVTEKVAENTLSHA